METRPQVGHWEGDLIDGAHGTGHLATLVERVTRYSLVGRTNSKEAEEVARRTCAVFRALPALSRRSVTYDNGEEFARHEEIASALTLEVFFAHPYHSWEWRGHCGRGTNENTNGLIRRLYPKKPSFAGIGEAELLRIESFLNDRPRKYLGWATPRERIAAFLGRAPQRHGAHAEPAGTWLAMPPRIFRCGQAQPCPKTATTRQENGRNEPQQQNVI